MGIALAIAAMAYPSFSILVTLTLAVGARVGDRVGLGLGPKRMHTR